MTCDARKKILWGCDGGAKQPVTIDGEPLTTCPRRPLLNNPSRFGYIFWLYRQFKDGYLPENGGLNNQPAKYIDYMNIIDRALDFCREENQKREERTKRSRGGPRAGR